MLLNYLGYKNIQIDYSIRTESQDFLRVIKNKNLEELIDLCKEDINEQYQDKFYFKKSIREINSEFKSCDHEFCDFLFENIKFLYVPISVDNATKVFSMMNGNKAKMKDDELVKAEILRLVSLEEKDVLQNVAWEQKELRSRYAREWDRWLYWWNSDEVQEFYHTTDIMGWLLWGYFKSKKDTEYNFQNFHNYCLCSSENKEKDVKNVFIELRLIQKKFEDVYNSLKDDKKLHNKIGSILCVLDKKDREHFIIDYFCKRNINDLEVDQYYKYVFLSLPHKIIFDFIKKNRKNSDEKPQDDNTIKTINDKIEEIIQALKNDFLYQDKDDYKIASLQLLRLNVDADSQLGRAFDFSIWKQKSLEHIWPKSKVYHYDNGQYLDGNDKFLDSKDTKLPNMLNRKDFGKLGSEHCIGNLVLLYSSENSYFKDKTFSAKKNMYFNIDERKRILKSLTLLHSLSVFAFEKWGVKEIQENKEKIIKEVKDYYGK